MRSSLTVAVLLSAGCSQGGPAPTPVGEGSASWPQSSHPVDASGLVFAEGPVVHLADGSTIDVGRAIESFVLAGDGVFFTATDDEPEEPDYAGGRPLYYSAGGAARQVAESASTLRASPDGRYVAFLDSASGEQDDYGTPRATAVVVDLDSGEEVVRSSEGMGDPDSQDLAHEYPETSDLGILRVTDHTAYVGAPGDVYAYDLTTGEGSVSATGDDEFELPPYDDRRSPDGAWRIVDDYPASHDRLRSRSGEVLAPDSGTPLIDLEWWVDAQTVAGVAIDGRIRQAQLSRGASIAFITCTVPSGRCHPVAGTQDTTIVLPEGVVDGSTMTLTDGR